MFIANILLFVNITVSVLLVIIILLQRASSGLGALGGGGGSSAAFSSSGTGNALSKATTILAILFMGSSLWLAVELGGKGREVSVIDSVAVETEAVDPADGAPAMPMTLPSSEGEQNAQ
ncbi:MAG: preprotein translocase subunit SecG [Alphaproteobacteria bacterium]|jgi:preprotein translocase subunit SecG